MKYIPRRRTRSYNIENISYCPRCEHCELHYAGLIAVRVSPNLVGPPWYTTCQKPLLNIYQWIQHERIPFNAYLSSIRISQLMVQFQLFFVLLLVGATGTNYSLLVHPGRGKCLPSLWELSTLLSPAKLGLSFDSVANTLHTHGDWQNRTV